MEQSKQHKMSPLPVKLQQLRRIVMGWSTIMMTLLVTFSMVDPSLSLTTAFVPLSSRRGGIKNVAPIMTPLLHMPEQRIHELRPNSEHRHVFVGTVGGTSSTIPVRSERNSHRLYMSSTERDTSRTTKKGTQVMDRTETQVKEDKKKEEMWRVVLHNDEVHTFNYVVRSLTKVIGTLDRKAAFEICVQTHGIGKATVTKTWKKQAEQFCLGLQRQGLTVSISPDEDFEGGHSGGGL